MAKKKIEIKWLSEPEEHDYLAAKSYLSLIYDESKANAICGEIEARLYIGVQGKGYFQGIPSVAAWGQQRARRKRSTENRVGTSSPAAIVSTRFSQW